MEGVQLAGQHHVWAGSTPVSSHPQPWPGFRPCSQQSCLLAAVQLGRVCREQPGLSGSALRCQEASGPGPIGSVLPLKLQGSRDRLPEPSAALFLLGGQVLPWASPSVPKLRWA